MFGPHYPRGMTKNQYHFCESKQCLQDSAGLNAPDNAGKERSRFVSLFSQEADACDAKNIELIVAQQFGSIPMASDVVWS